MVRAALFMYNGSGGYDMKKVHVIATGGTIAAAGGLSRTTGYQIGCLHIDSIIGDMAMNTLPCEVEWEELFNIFSDDITAQRWLRLAGRINELASDPDICGFVVTHGTNTLEDTAYFLNLTVKTDKPVVVTGAMRPATAISADGPFNLIQAIALAADDKAAGRGVLVLFSDAIYGAREARKISTYRPQAFGGGDAGCLGFMQDDRSVFIQESVKAHTLASEFDVRGLDALPRVDILYFYADAPVEQIRYVDSRVKGLVLAGVGGGYCSEGWKVCIREYARAGIPVVRTSKIANGIVSFDDIDDYCGTLPAGTLSPGKARILLMLALTQSPDADSIRRVIAKY